MKWETLVSECKALTSINIPKSVTSIGNSAFSGCSGLTSINIPESVTSIADWAFSHCGSLTSIAVDLKNTIYDSRDNCNAIVETKSNTLVAGCQSTTIPESITIIGDDAFAGCTSLESIDIPESVTRIGNNAFNYCSSLTSFNIPESVTSIGTSVFLYCNSLTSVFVPKSVTNIRDVFDYYYGSDALASVRFESVNPPLANGTIPTSATIYIPEGSLAAYQSAPGWGTRYTYVEFEVPNSDALSNVTSIRTTSATYDISGRRVNDNPTHPGIYIRDGKKHVVK